MSVLRLELPDKSGGHYKVKKEKKIGVIPGKLQYYPNVLTLDKYVLLNNKTMTMIWHIN